jgi:hypothetical protein
MDRVNEVTSQQHPKLVDFKKCKNKGIRAGLFSIITVGCLSYAVLKVPSIGQLIPVKYHTLFILGGALGSSYIVAAITTKQCFSSLKTQTQTSK